MPLLEFNHYWRIEHISIICSSSLTTKTSGRKAEVRSLSFRLGWHKGRPEFRCLLLPNSAVSWQSWRSWWTKWIRAKAFRGELVPQDRNDEPASALLARIREARRTKPRRRNMDDLRSNKIQVRFAPHESEETNPKTSCANNAASPGSVLVFCSLFQKISE